jgi:hypothetical protein
LIDLFVRSLPIKLAQKIILGDKSMQLVKYPIGMAATLALSGVLGQLVEQNARAALDATVYGYALKKGEIALHGPAQHLELDPSVINVYLGAAHRPVPSAESQTA